MSLASPKWLTPTAGDKPLHPASPEQIESQELLGKGTVHIELKILSALSSLWAFGLKGGFLGVGEESDQDNFPFAW